MSTQAADIHRPQGNTLAECAERALARFPGTSRAATDDRTFYFTSLLAYAMCNAGDPVGAKLLDLVALDALPQPLQSLAGKVAQPAEGSPGNWALEFEAQLKPGFSEWFRSPHPVRPREEAEALVQRLNSTGKPPTYRCIPVAPGDY